MPNLVRFAFPGGGRRTCTPAESTAIPISNRIRRLGRFTLHEWRRTEITLPSRPAPARRISNARRSSTGSSSNIQFFPAGVAPACNRLGGGGTVWLFYGKVVPAWGFQPQPISLEGRHAMRYTIPGWCVAWDSNPDWASFEARVTFDCRATRKMAGDPGFAPGLCRLRGAGDCLLPRRSLKRVVRWPGAAPGSSRSQRDALLLSHAPDGASGRCRPGCILATREAFCC